jgi:hypothetical protein
MILSENNLNASTIALFKNFKTPKFNSSKFKKKVKTSIAQSCILGSSEKNEFKSKFIGMVRSKS